MTSDDKIKSIEDRLSRIEDRLNLAPLRKPEVKPSTSVTSETLQTEKIHDKQETRSGNWLGYIALICFILAAGFIIKLSIDSGWLTPARQIGIAIIFGLSLIGCGIKFLNVDREYTSLLPACGIIILYASIFSAHRFYSLITFQTAIICFGAISLFCIYLYLKIKHDIYPITAALGAYLSPVLLDLHANTIFSLYYFIICSFTFAILSIWVKSRLLTMISAYLAIFLTAYIGFGLQQNELIATILAIQFFIFSLGVYFYTSIRKQPLTERESWSFFPVLLLFYIAEYHFIYLINPDLAAWISLGFATFLILLYLMAKKIMGSAIVTQSMIMTFAAIVFFHAGYLELLPEAAGTWLFVVLMMGFALLPTRFYSKEGNIRSFAPFLLFIFVVLGLEYVKMAFKLHSFDNVSWPAVTLAIASIWTLFICQNNLLTKDGGFGYALLAAAHLLVILSLYRLADAHGSLAVSASWLIYAIAIIVFAFIRKDKIMANSALLVLFFSAGKALLYDAASAPTIVRILCLLMTGVVLYGAGLLYRRIAKWKV